MTGLVPTPLEEAFVALLTPVHTPVPVSTRIPNPRPATFVRIQRTGGDQANLIQERPTFLFEHWATKPLDAFKLAQKTWGLLEGRDELILTFTPEGGDPLAIELTARSLSLPVNYPDPASTSPRYQFTGTFTADLIQGATP